MKLIGLVVLGFVCICERMTEKKLQGRSQKWWYVGGAVGLGPRLMSTSLMGKAQHGGMGRGSVSASSDPGALQRTGVGEGARRLGEGDVSAMMYSTTASVC